MHMGLLKKKPDPISERAQALTEEIAALEAQIKRLDSKLHTAAAAPRLRSTALPHGATTVLHPAPPPSAPDPAEPIFEEVNHARLNTHTEAVTDSEPANDIGVRQNNFAGFLNRLKNSFRGPSTMNPKLVNYLAAGSIQGLRPMRYEKRVARYRFLFLVVIILLFLLGIWSVFRPR